MDFAPYCAAGLIAPRKVGDVKAWQKLDYISWEDSWGDLPMAEWLHATFPDKAAALACNSMQAHHAAIHSGLRIGMLPCFVGDKDASLQRLAPKETPLSRDLWLVYHRDLKASQRVIALREFVQGLVRSLF
jgi:DNA-binding transcriptional LysR family regulator